MYSPIMKKVFLSFLLSSFICFTNAQDKNVLAKIAYEDAETAYAAGNLVEAIDELNKVDSLLGKKTPKSQYLRVQTWLLAVEHEPSNIDNAITACKDYLDLSKSFDIPEEKVIDVTRTLTKLQKKNSELEKKEIEDRLRLKNFSEKAEKAQKFFDSIFLKYNCKPGLTEEEFKKMNPFAFTGMTRSENKKDQITTFNRKEKFFSHLHAEGPEFIQFSNGLLTSYHEIISFSKYKAELEGKFNKIREIVTSNIPENYIRFNQQDLIVIAQSKTSQPITWFLVNDDNNYFIQISFK
jgi:hypothetical protein